MPAQIHPSAIVESTVELGQDVEIGPFAYVSGRVVIGDGTKIHHHATVEGLTTIGRACEIFPYASIGSKTHDLKYKGGLPGLRVGDRNVFREYVTVHAATKDGEFTVLGDDNVILAYSHIAHDCIIGSRLVMSSHAALAGHVVVEDDVNMGWNAGVHQFCRVGAHGMIGACSKIVQDVPPYLIIDGAPALVRSINKVGLERSGFTPERIEFIKAAYRIFYREGLNRSQALE
ncbi:MAG: acyl-ACP--UDP-N-acetylglucosamine O-acyltransferase, partial [Verrucomicrobiota bacterium]|nr:acyl-ACP--UDP-N-acetylglucosamine O-acyltransferase [Verrucomicrobiota bacterium]